MWICWSVESYIQEYIKRTNFNMTTMAEKLYDDKGVQRNTNVEKRSYKELRKAITQNLREREQFKSRTNAIDRERRSLRAQLDREEHELRAQLDRLELEREALGDLDLLEGEVFDSEDFYCDDLLSQETEVTNPYPVTLGRPRQSTSSGRDEPSGKGSRRQRKISPGQESLESCSKILPPIQSTSRQSLVSTSRQSLVSAKSDASFTPRAASASYEEQQCWVGEPEAISSVRRPRKTIAQQRSESHVWKRSRSLKEHAQQGNTSRSSISTIGRSQSLRDGKCGGRALIRSGLSRAESRSSNLSQSPSMRELDIQLSVECLNIDPVIEAELNRGPAHRCLRRHVGASNSSFSKHPVLGSSPDTKSTVWGWIKDVTPDSESDNDTKAHDNETMGAKSNSPSESESLEKLKRKSPSHKHPRPLPDIKKVPESVGVIGNTPLIPSPSHLSVEKCYELLSSTPIGAQQNPVQPKLEVIASVSD